MLGRDGTPARTLHQFWLSTRAARLSLASLGAGKVAAGKNRA
jgi:hypothetical protein